MYIVWHMVHSTKGIFSLRNNNFVFEAEHAGQHRTDQASSTEN